MTRGNVGIYKVFYRGDNDDFLVFIDDVQMLKKWKTDRSTPMAQVVSGFHVFVTHRQGAQGIHDTASNAILHAEFGTEDVVACIKKILEKGEVQETENPQRYGTKNDSMGPRVAH
ncbi:hypothetical protein GX51_03365 [Blastomyces parvus]|uniref:Ribosome maturation protein SDO1/SBDS N-terminal domain-containing protein n=1 Tax=Blastomyces parvus TaxID=2060905 RepID=A0A2B7X7R2_9EURO|nr:hypothetical protein GX51_03365 [Blastomyces parvus]